MSADISPGLPIRREQFIVKSPGPQLPVLRQSRVVGGRRGPGLDLRNWLRPVKAFRVGSRARTRHHRGL
jgi:hypothetical protein